MSRKTNRYRHETDKIALRKRRILLEATIHDHECQLAVLKRDLSELGYRILQLNMLEAAKLTEKECL